MLDKTDSQKADKKEGEPLLEAAGNIAKSSANNLSRIQFFVFFHPLSLSQLERDFAAGP